MIDNNITQETVCEVWANKDENKIEDPTGTIPLVSLPDRNQYDGWFKGGDILDFYEAESTKMDTLHNEWREVALTWSKRNDEILAQVYVLNSILRDLGAAPPVDEFEDFTSETFGLYLVSGIGLVQGAWALGGKALYHRLFPSTAPIAPAPPTTWLKTRKAVKWGGRFVAAAGTVASVSVIILDLHKRNESMVEVIPKFQSWMYGEDENGSPIAKPVIPTEAQIQDEEYEVTLGGAAGRIIEMRRAVAAIKEEIKIVAGLVGVPILDDNNSERDINLIFCETKKILDNSVRNGGQVRAAQDVATRMLCIDRWDDNVSYTDAQISQVTGVPVVVVVGQRADVAADHDGDLCPGIATGTG